MSYPGLGHRSKTTGSEIRIVWVQVLPLTSVWPRVSHFNFHVCRIGVIWICLAQGMALLGGMALLEEVWPCWGNVSLWGWTLRPSLLLAAWKPVFCLPLEQDVELSTPPAPCLPRYCHALHHDDNELNLWTCKLDPIKCCPLKTAIVVVSFTAMETLTKTSGPRFDYQNPYVYAWPSVTPTPRYSILFGLSMYQTCMWCTYMQVGKTPIHIKIKINEREWERGEE